MGRYDRVRKRVEGERDEWQKWVEREVNKTEKVEEMFNAVEQKQDKI